MDSRWVLNIPWFFRDITQIQSSLLIRIELQFSVLKFLGARNYYLREYAREFYYEAVKRDWENQLSHTRNDKKNSLEERLLE